MAEMNETVTSRPRRHSKEPLKTGAIFGRLVVVEDRGSQEVQCLCECLTPVIAMRHRLRQGIIQSCSACTKLYGWRRQRGGGKETEVSGRSAREGEGA